MTDRIKTLWVGVFVIAALMLAAWLLLFLRPSIGDGGRTLRVRFANVEKITIGTRVTFAGRPVGEVSAIKEMVDPNCPRCPPADSSGTLYIYELLLKVDSSVRIFTYDKVTVATAGLLGERMIDIIPKAPPPGFPPPCEITDEILYAKSTDAFNEALTQMETMVGKVSSFIDENKEVAHRALTSFAEASTQIFELASHANDAKLAERTAAAADELKNAMAKADTVFGQIRDENLVLRMSKAFESAGSAFEKFHRVGDKLSSGEGSLGRLLHSDQFYLQMTDTFNRFETTLDNINQYGLLFQYDKRWQRQQIRQRARLQQLSQPEGFYNYFNGEIREISSSLTRVSGALQLVDVCQTPLQDPCFAEQFRFLLERVKGLEENLQLFQQKLSQEYSQKCYCN